MVELVYAQMTDKKNNKNLIINHLLTIFNSKLGEKETQQILDKFSIVQCIISPIMQCFIFYHAMFYFPPWSVLFPIMQCFSPIMQCFTPHHVVFISIMHAV